MHRSPWSRRAALPLDDLSSRYGLEHADTREKAIAALQEVARHSCPAAA
jgi:hypothetical protein